MPSKASLKEAVFVSNSRLKQIVEVYNAEVKSKQVPFPPYLICPLTNKPLKNPVIAKEDGETYDQDAFKDGLRISPKNEQQIGQFLYPNYKAKEILEDIEKMTPEEKNELKIKSKWVEDDAILLDIMKDPVIAVVNDKALENGRSFEKENIEKLKKEGKPSPTVRESLNNAEFISNNLLKKIFEIYKNELLEDYKKRHPNTGVTEATKEQLINKLLLERSNTA